MKNSVFRAKKHTCGNANLQTSSNCGYRKAYTPAIHFPLKLGNVSQASMSVDLAVAHQTQAPNGSKLTIAKSSHVALKNSTHKSYTSSFNTETTMAENQLLPLSYLHQAPPHTASAHTRARTKRSDTKC